MKYLYVANWKMTMSLNDGINFCTENKAELTTLSQHANIILCPSFIALTSIIKLINNTIAVGAQNCCEYAAGAYTGEVSASFLQEIGVAYCIIGHSERRMYYHETSDIIIKKIEQLFSHNIQPIICIGETKQNFIDKKTYEILTEQIDPLLFIIQKNHKPIIIAYEPVWSIGTGIIPELVNLQKIFVWLRQYVDNKLQNNSIKFLYGGSVNSNNAHQLKTIEHIDGFLIGSASTDFKEFEKIILR